MHPEIMREMTAQRGHELRERAYRARLARTANGGRRVFGRRARQLDEADAFVVPAIPDYVDGSFQTAANQVASQVPAARRAA